MTGATGSGKSHLTRSIFLTAQGNRTIIDPVDSDLTKVPGARTFRDVSKWEHYREGTSRFVPRDPQDIDEYNELYRRIHAGGSRYVWVDEGGFVFPVRRAPRTGVLVLLQGRKRMLGQITCHTRPREIDPNVISQAQHVAMFSTPLPDDRQRLAELIGLVPRELDQLLEELPEFGFLWWNQRDRQLTLVDPLPR